MTQDYKHPIAPPEEVVQQWLAEPEYVAGGNGRCTLISVTDHRLSSICAKAAQWGFDQTETNIERERQEAADKEREAICEWILGETSDECFVANLRAARRPKSEKQQALDALFRLSGCSNTFASEDAADAAIILRVLESIPDPS